jgi:hypothetical protein
MRKRVTYD